MGKVLNLLFFSLGLAFLLALAFVSYKSIQYLGANSKASKTEIQNNTTISVSDSPTDEGGETEEEFDLDEVLRSLDEEDEFTTLDDEPDPDSLEIDIEAILADEEETELPEVRSALERRPVNQLKSGSKGGVSAAATLPAGAPSPYEGEKNIYVVSGSFRQLINAETEIKRLKKAGYPNARIANIGSKAFAVVVTDNYPNELQAKKVADELKSKLKITAYIYTSK